MIRLQDIKKTHEELVTLELITRAFGEIASNRMLQTRTGVISNREYLSELTALFDEVRASYSSEIKKIAQKYQKGNKKNITFLSHNGKTVSVLFSASHGLYGPIIKETFELFLDEVKKGNTEVTIVGEIGRGLFQSIYPNKPFTYFELSDKKASKEELTALARHIVQYDEIHFFYGKFQNIVSQKPEVSSISSNLSTNVMSKQSTKYLFEPSLEAVLVFFESELFGSVLKQTTEESTLAKLGSRVFAMDEATSKISHERKKLLESELGLIHREANKKQLNSLSGILTLI